MDSFYDSVLKSILESLQKQDYESAAAMAKQELDMPYVPPDVKEQLESSLHEAAGHLQKKPAESSMELDKWIHGTLHQKEKAASALQAMNLRMYSDQVQQLLNDPELAAEFKGELVEALMEQKIDEEFTMNKDGLNISFVPSLITPARDDAVLKKARQYFDQWLFANDAMSCRFASSLLDQETLEMRPFDFEGIDPKELAASIVHLVYDAMKNEEGWEKFVTQNHLEDVQEYPVSIKKRGELQS